MICQLCHAHGPGPPHLHAKSDKVGGMNTVATVAAWKA